VLAATYCLSVLPIDRLWVCPAYQHALGKSLTSFKDRVALCERAFAPLGARAWVSDVEAHANGGGRTIRLVEYILRHLPNLTIYLILGADILGELDRWLEVPRLWSLTRPIVLARAGSPYNDDPRVWPITLPSVSSSALRALFAEGHADACAPLIPRAVMAEISARGLYAP
jgi:nicotinic acid mononucleotide adenylyltransferase